MTPIERINHRINLLASFSEDSDGLTRPFCCHQAKLVNEEIRTWAVSDNLDFNIDQLANIRLRLKNHDDNKKTFVVASHLDSVVNAGKYDGPLGFLIGYEMIKYCADNKLELPFNIEAIGFSDEEGVRYQTTYLGSSAVAGTFKKEWLDHQDKDGISMRQALEDFNCDCNQLETCAIDADKWLGYYEVHIEQGPVLQNQDLACGFVKNIYGQVRIEFNIIGFAGHAGTVPMGMRQDALAGFGEFSCLLEEFGEKNKEHLVATIGQCKVLPGASNVIPGEIIATIDLRSYDETILEIANNEMEFLLNKVCKKRNLTNKYKIVQNNPPVICDKKLNRLLADAVKKHSGKKVSLSSGAGHDAVAISKVAPVSMLFVRCKDGISHNPAEYASPEDIGEAYNVSITYLNNLIEQYKK